MQDGFDPRPGSRKGPSGSGTAPVGAVSRFARVLTAGSLAAFSLFILSALGPGPEVAQAAPCDPPVQNPIVCENSKTGNPASEWDISGGGAGDPDLQGFATDISVNHGETVHFKIDTPYSAYHLDIYRMGYYNGDGARQVDTVTPSASLPQTQPDCIDDPTTTGLTDCGNWAESASWAVPADAVSGIYFAKLVRDGGGASDGSHIFFIVRDDTGQSDLLFQTQDTTWEAYNQYGGRSLYQSSDNGPGTNPARAYKVSYNRPLTTRGPTPEDSPFNAEYPMVRWLERNGYDVSYFTGIDSARRGSEILDHKTFLSVGHDEYWSGANAPTSRPREMPASTSHSSAATRASGRRAGSPAQPTARAPTTAPSSVTRRLTRAPRSTPRRTSMSDFADRRIDQEAAIEVRHQLHVRRQQFCVDLLDLGVDAVEYARRIFALEQHDDAGDHVGLFVLADDAVAFLIRQLHVADVAQQGWRAALGTDDDVAEVVERLNQADAADDECLFATHEIAAAGTRAVFLQCIDDAAETEPIRLQLVGIDLHLELHGLTAEVRHVGNTRNLLERRNDGPALQFGQFATRAEPADSSVYRKISPIGDVSGSSPGCAPYGNETAAMRSSNRCRAQ